MKVFSKAGILLVIVFSSIGFGEVDELSFSVEITYMSKFMDHGEEYFGEQGGWEQTLDITFADSGFGVSVGHRHAADSGYVDSERFDYSVYYNNSLFPTASYKTEYRISWIYHNYPDMPRTADNTQEFEAEFSMPEFFSCGVIPVYAVCYEYPAGSGYDNRDMAGFIHTFGMIYPLDIEHLQSPLELSADIEYRDGLGGANIDHDFSHITFAACTCFEITESLTLTPGLYHQLSMDDSVCTKDITYTALTVHYDF